MRQRKISLRRNDSEKMGRELEEREEPVRQLYGDSSVVYLATFINPVDHRLYDVIYADSEVHIVAPMPNAEYKEKNKRLYSFGDGHIDRYDTKEVDKGRYSVQLARSHTPSGVGAKGTGQGLMLYCGLAIYAKYMGIDGIYSSLESRSEAATGWWRTQVKRNFAEEDHQYTTGYTTVEVNLEDTVDVNNLYVGDIFDRDSESINELRITDIEPSAVEVQVSVEGELEIQYITAERVAEAGYCIAWNSEDESIEELFSESGEPQPKEVILGIDLSTTADPKLIEALISDLQEGDASEEELRLFLNRVPKRLLKQLKSSNVKEIYGQLRLPLPEDEELVANMSTTSHSPAWKNFFGEAVNSN